MGYYSTSQSIIFTLQAQNLIGPSEKPIVSKWILLPCKLQLWPADSSRVSLLVVEMDQSSFSYRNRKPRPKSELYSTVVVHDDEADDERTLRRSKARSNEPEEDLYATMVYKDNGHEEDEDDDSSLPPLLKRLPKDFGGGAPMDYDDDFEEDSGDYGTMIVKTDRSRNRNWSSSTSSPSMGSTWKAKGTPLRQPSPMNRMSSGNDDVEEDDGDGGFSTFIVRSRSSERESVSGTVVRRTGGGSGGIDTGSTMERAVASMQGVGEGFGKQKRGSGSLQGEEGRFSLTTKISTRISTSSIPESVTREDPTTKYELLNELGA